MKKIFISALACLALMGTSCSTMLLNNNALGTSTSTSTSTSGSSLGSSALGGLLDLVLGSASLSQSEIIGTWKYVEPSCAFTSENLLAKAGGSVAAQQAKAKLSPIYQQVGISSSNTYFTFGQDGQFSGKLKGVPMSGTYTFNSSDGSVKMKTLLASMTAYLCRTSKGMSFNFESKKLLSAMQTISALSGNSTVSAIGEISKSYDGIRVGFNMSK